MESSIQTCQETKYETYKVNIDEFVGPLDLLLHLVGKEELDITAISLAKIADEYFEYIKLMQNLNLEVESSYLLILATLLKIKSRALLHAEEKIKADLELENESEAELIKKLREYKIFKETAVKLSELEKGAALSFVRGVDADEDEMIQTYIELSFFDLISAFRDFLSKRNEKINKQLNFEKEKYSVTERMSQIYEILMFRKKIGFFEVMGENSAKIEIIITFLAILELIRIQKVAVVQEINDREIYLYKRSSRSATDEWHEEKAS